LQEICLKGKHLEKSEVPFCGVIFANLFHSQTDLTIEMPGEAAGNPGMCERT